VDVCRLAVSFDTPNLTSIVDLATIAILLHLLYTSRREGPTTQEGTRRGLTCEPAIRSRLCGDCMRYQRYGRRSNDWRKRDERDVRFAEDRGMGARTEKLLQNIINKLQKIAASYDYDN